MKFGFRIPNLNKRIAARMSVKRMIRQSLGLKAPRGWGWLTNPRRALYNRVYTRTTVGLPTGGKGCMVALPLLLGGMTALVWAAVIFLGL
jgi:hypothetical protein